MKPCNQIHVFKGPCTLEYGHEGDHVWKNPAATGPTTRKTI
jgi:hypothetical protein